MILEVVIALIKRKVIEWAIDSKRWETKLRPVNPSRKQRGHMTVKFNKLIKILKYLARRGC